MRVVRTALPAAAAALVLASCGGSTFKAPDVPFTFSKPGDFSQQDADADKVLARVLPDVADTNNAIKIRKASDREYPLRTLINVFQPQFQRQLKVPVRERFEQHSDIEMGVLTFTKKVSLPEGGKGSPKPTTLSSSSYFFHGAGKTWQVECLSTDTHKAEIDKACTQAIDSIKF